MISFNTSSKSNTEKCKEGAGKENWIDTVVNVINKHTNCAAVCEQGCINLLEMTNDNSK